MNLSRRALNMMVDESAPLWRRIAAARTLRVWVFIYRFHLIHEARKEGHSWREIRGALRGE